MKAYSSKAHLMYKIVGFITIMKLLTYLYTRTNGNFLMWLSYLVLLSLELKHIRILLMNKRIPV